MSGISGTLNFDPSQMAGLNPGANTSGQPGSTLGPMTTSGTLGNTSSPFVPSPTTGTNMPAYSSPYAPSGATAGLAGLAPGAGGSAFGRPGGIAQQDDLARGFQAAGMPGGVGTTAAQFLQSGAGFNPQVAQALIAALQPQIAKGQANIMEQFGNKGLGLSSPAALGLGDYLAQTNLDVGTLLSGMYEQSVNDYMQVLGMGKAQPKQGGGILGALGSLLGGLGGASTSGGTLSGELLGMIGL